MGRRIGATTEQQLPLGIAGSVLFHALIFAAVIFTFQRNFSAPQENHIVPVDLVTLADKTNVAAEAPKPEPEKFDRPEPPAPEPPPEPEMQAVEPAPEPPIPQFDVAKEKPKPVDKPQPTKKQMEQDFLAALNRLAPDKPVKAAKAGPRAIPGAGAGNQMTADLADMLYSQIHRCFSSPQGVPQDRQNDLVVFFQMQLGPDGRVIDAQSPSTNPGNPSSYNLAAALAARRAIYQCQPYHLPADRYQLWRDVQFRFDGREQ